MGTPIEIDDLTISDDTDLVALLESVLTGSAGHVLPEERDSGDWLFRAYPLLVGTDHEARFTAAVAACLTDESPTVRSAAVNFFAKFTDLPGAERLVEVAGDQRSLFADLPGPDRSQGGLLRVLLRAVSARIMAGDERALDLARREALSGDMPQPLIAALTRREPDWVEAHAPEIVEAHPDTAAPILFNLQELGRDILEVGRQIAPAAARDEAFVPLLVQVVEERKVREAIIAAAKTETE